MAINTGPDKDNLTRFTFGTHDKQCQDFWHEERQLFNGTSCSPTCLENQHKSYNIPKNPTHAVFIQPWKLFVSKPSINSWPCLPCFLSYRHPMQEEACPASRSVSCHWLKKTAKALADTQRCPTVHFKQAYYCFQKVLETKKQSGLSKLSKPALKHPQTVGQPISDKMEDEG